MLLTLLTVILMEQFCISILISYCLKTESSKVEGDVLEKKNKQRQRKKM